MKKILEISGADWMKGYSAQATIARDGVFRAAVGFNPFEQEGMMIPSLSPTTLTAPTDAPRVITSWNSSGTGYFYANTPSKLYQYLQESPYTQTDVTAQVTHSQPIAGAIIWKDKYIYAEYSGNVRVFANALPVASASEVEIMSNTVGSLDIRPMCVGADQNLYIGDRNYVSKLTSTTGTSGNTFNYFPIDVGFNVRALVNDGRYLVIMADNNAQATSSRVVGAYKCRVYFWDMGKTTADAIYDIQDSYLIAGAFKDGKVYVFGYNGIYVCNLVTAPKMIWDFRGNSTITRRPLHFYNVSVGSSDVFWADGSTNGQFVYALRGNVIYSPYTTHDSTYSHTAITAIADTLVVATSQPNLYLHNVGTTRGSATIQTTIETLQQPYTYEYTKVTLRSPLSTGQSITVNVLTGVSGIISDTATRSYTTDGAKTELIFRRVGGASVVNQFEDIWVQIVSVAGAIVERVAVYASPIGDHIQA